MSELRVTYLYRRPLPVGHFSIEFLFDKIHQNLPKGFTARKFVASVFSSGLLPRIKIVRECSKNASDINHITGDIHFVALGLPRKNTILTIHDLGFLRVKNPVARFVLKMFWVTLPVRRVAAVTVVSETTKRELLAEVNVAPEKIHVIGNFISDNFDSQPKEFNASCPTILQIGCAPNKNIPRLANALKGIKCKLVIVGNLSDSTRSLLQKNEIDFVHKSCLSEDALRDEYVRCDMVSFVSLLEGFGMPILEAQKTGRIVITSNISSMPDVAGDGALLVDPTDESAIRSGILELINNQQLRDSLISNGYKNANRFDIASVIEQYCSLYKKIRSEM